MSNKIKFLFILSLFVLSCTDSPSYVYVPSYDGCLDESACNYDPGADNDDGSCEYTSCIVYGCTNEQSCNYNPLATIDDDTCYYTINQLSESLDLYGLPETDEGACLLPNNTIYITLNGDVLYNISEEIAGFQINMTGGTALSISEGDATDADFFISGSSTILGVSFSGGTIPAGCGKLFEVSLSGLIEDVDVIISNPSGNEIDVSYLSGCNCQLSSTIDCAGICGGSDDSCADCEGVPNGNTELDCAGICGGTSINCEVGNICVKEDTCDDLIIIQSIIDANSSSMAGEDAYSLADWDENGRAYRLKLSDKGITTIPSNIDDLTELRQLFLSYNSIAFLNYNISNLTNLEHLYLSFNEIISLPPTIGNLSNLITLDVESNNLTEIPSEIVNLNNLETLNIGLNSLSELPNLTTLDNLVTLYANHNLLESLPSSITSLSSLSILNLDSNQLTELPGGLCSMPSLSSLSIINNQICEDLDSDCNQVTIVGESNQNCD